MLHCDNAPISDVMSFLFSNPQRHMIVIFPLIKLHEAALGICVPTGEVFPDCWDVSSNKLVGLVHALHLLTCQPT